MLSVCGQIIHAYNEEEENCRRNTTLKMDLFLSAYYCIRSFVSYSSLKSYRILIFSWMLLSVLGQIIHAYNEEEENCRGNITLETDLFPGAARDLKEQRDSFFRRKWEENVALPRPWGVSSPRSKDSSRTSGKIVSCYSRGGRDILQGACWPLLMMPSYVGLWI